MHNDNDENNNKKMKRRDHKESWLKSFRAEVEQRKDHRGLFIWQIKMFAQTLIRQN